MNPRSKFEQVCAIFVIFVYLSTSMLLLEWYILQMTYVMDVICWFSNVGWMSKNIRVAYVLLECWFISVPANFRRSICPLFRKGHAENFMLETRTYGVPGICRKGNESTFWPNIGPFFLFIISFIYNCLIGNMSTDAEVVGGSARLEDPIEAANHYFDYLDEH